MTEIYCHKNWSVDFNFLLDKVNIRLCFHCYHGEVMVQRQTTISGSLLIGTMFYLEILGPNIHMEGTLLYTTLLNTIEKTRYTPS